MENLRFRERKAVLPTATQQVRVELLSEGPSDCDDGPLAVLRGECVGVPSGCPELSWLWC